MNTLRHEINMKHKRIFIETSGWPLGAVLYEYC